MFFVGFQRIRPVAFQLPAYRPPCPGSLFGMLRSGEREARGTPVGRCSVCPPEGDRADSRIILTVGLFLLVLVMVVVVLVMVLVLLGMTPPGPPKKPIRITTTITRTIRSEPTVYKILYKNLEIKGGYTIPFKKQTIYAFIYVVSLLTVFPLRPDTVLIVFSPPSSPGQKPGQKTDKNLAKNRIQKSGDHVPTPLWSRGISIGCGGAWATGKYLGKKLITKNKPLFDRDVGQIMVYVAHRKPKKTSKTTWQKTLSFLRCSVFVLIFIIFSYIFCCSYDLQVFVG